MEIGDKVKTGEGYIGTVVKKYPNDFCDVKLDISGIFMFDEDTLLPVIEFKPFDKVLVREDEYDIWKPSIISMSSHFDGKKIWYWCIDNKEYTEVIPYEGNEKMAGTRIKYGN